MDDLKQLNTLIGQLYQLANQINYANRFEILMDTNTDLLNKINLLEEKLVIKTRDLDEMKNKYDCDMNIKNNELKENCEELKNLTKVSFVQSLNKQLNDKNLIIQQLENQISKLKMNKTNENKSNILVDEHKTKKEDVNLNAKEIVQDKNKESDNLNTLELIENQENKTKKKKKQPELFNPDNFEDINGYELISYKKNYYLRDLETNELYNVVHNKPGEIIGLLSSKGKVKFS